MSKCPKCQGLGITRWQAFVDGLAWLIAGLLGEPIDPAKCPACDGVGVRP